MTLAEYQNADGLNPHVKFLVEFLLQRDAGKNGRYLEAHRKDREPRSYRAEEPTNGETAHEPSRREEPVDISGPTPAADAVTS